MQIFDRRWPALCVAFSFAFFSAAAVAAQDVDPDEQRLAEYRLTDEGLDNFAQASRNLFAAVKADPNLAQEMEAPDDASMEDLAAMYDAQPAAREALESAGMTSLEYVTFMFAMFQAGMAAYLVEEYGQTELPEGTPRENVDYYMANKDKLAALTAEMEKLNEEVEEAEAADE